MDDIELYLAETSYIFIYKDRKPYQTGRHEYNIAYGINRFFEYKKYYVNKLYARRCKAC